jgi:NF-X1-type zinc finger protein NFXL1
MSLYDSIYGANSTTNEISYTTGSPDITYPDAQFTNVLGTVFLPRIYGKDLSCLEIGTSGKIAITLTDINSFDISNTNSVILFNAVNAEAFNIQPKDTAKTVGLADMVTFSSNAYQQMGTSNASGFNFMDDVMFSGAVNISGAMDLSGSLNLSGSLTVASNVQIEGFTDINGTLNVQQKAVLQNSLEVQGVTALSNDLYVLGNTDLNGTLNVQQSSVLQSSLEVQGVTALSNDLFVLGNTDLNGTLNVQQSSVLQSSLEVQGVTALSNDLFVLGKTDLNGTLNVQEYTLLQNTLQVAGNSTFSNDVLVKGNEVIESTLKVIGLTTLSNDLLIAGKELLQGTLEVVSAVTFDNTLQVVGNSTFSNDVLVVGKELIQSTLEVVGVTSLSNDLLVAGNEILQGTLQVVGATALSNALTVTGVSAFTNTVTISNLIVTDQVSFTGSVPSVFENLIVNGVASLNGKVNVDDSVGISNDLTLQGLADFNSTLNVQGGVLFQETLQVQNSATFSNDVLINGTLQVINAVSLSNVLNVDGKSTFNDSVVVGISDAGVNNATKFIGIGTASPTVTLDMSPRTDGIILPSGNNAARPAGVTGTIRYNSELSTYEGYGNGAWNGLGGVIDVDKNTYISAEDAPNVNNNQLKFVTNSVQRMIIQADGTVGIGTDVNPGAYELYVSGTTHFNGDVTGNQNLTIQSTVNAGDLKVGGVGGVGISNNLTVLGQVIGDEYISSTGITITAPTIRLEGDVQVTGSLDTINTNSINVEDLWITLASSGNSNLPTREGGLDNKAGVVIEGLPSNLTVSASNTKYYEKSIRWNMGEGTGTKGLATNTTFRDDPYWDVKGGSLLISRYTSSNYGLDFTDLTNYEVPEIGFMFRINSNEELEVVKVRVDAGGVRSGNVVSRFGVQMPNLFV